MKSPTKFFVLLASLFLACVAAVSAPAQPADYSVYPHLAGKLDLAGENMGLAGFPLWGDDYFAVCNETSGLMILQVSGDTLGLVGSIDVIGQEKDIQVADWYGFVSTSGGLAAVSLAVPATPSSLGFVNLAGDGDRQLALSATHAYVACGSAGLAVIDISNPSGMYVADWYGADVTSVWLEGDRLGVTNGGRFDLLDISTPIPALLGYCESVSQYDYHSTVIAGDNVYAQGGNQVDRWDFSNPASPVIDPTSPIVTLPVSSGIRLLAEGIDLQVIGNSYLGYFDLATGDFQRESGQIWIARDIAIHAGLMVTTAREALMLYREGLRSNATAAGEYDPTGFMNPKGIMLGDVMYGKSLTQPLTVTAAGLNDGAAHLWDLGLGFGSFIHEFDHRGSLLSALGGLPYEIRLVTASRHGAVARGSLVIPDLNPTSATGYTATFFDDDHLAVLDTEYGGDPGRILVIDVSDPDAPFLAHTYTFTGSDHTLLCTDSAFLHGSNISVEVVDARDLGNLNSAGTLPLGAQYIFTKGDFLYALRTAYYGARLETWDLSDPTAPALTGEIPLARLAEFVVEGEYAYQAKTGLILDLSDPAYPVPAGNFSLPNPALNTMDRIIAGGQYLLTGNTRSSDPFYPLHFLANQGGTGEVSFVPGDTPKASLSLELQATPNPFNPRVTLQFALPTGAETTIEVFDVRGRLVATLGEKRREAGLQTVDWEGTDRGGRHLPSGVYLARVKAGDMAESLKIVLAR